MEKLFLKAYKSFQESFSYDVFYVLILFFLEYRQSYSVPARI
ncbi:hypothetical protein LEP1GSC013_2932 [Leptospira interrogans serovar Valbuzzi str. Duyster]|nr:hypothetical protein LEP1GSC013_2932 [Leptospira interrogans serovar Valbuzzi str. Duyster]ENO74227.1 hypothetical protein LEP1GSC012_3727 [Leptospira interrogans serovar Valbuzzi str. Valbuzzi]